jgi:hypothetical protein
MLFHSGGGAPRHDFTGSLPVGWPRDADQYDLNQASALFPRGFRGTLKDDLDVAGLHERGVASAADPHTLFDVGAAHGGWRLTLEDFCGASEVRAPAFHSPGGALNARAINLDRQEGALALSWTGNGAALFLRHPPVDFSRDANADCCLTLQFQGAGGALRMRLHTADGSSRALELKLDDARKSPAGQMDLEFALKAFDMSAGMLTQIVAISLEAARPLDMVLVKLSITARVPAA